MAKLQEGGYRTLGLPEAVDYVRRGGPFPDHSVAITFDDGYQTVYEKAFPVLQRHGMSATVFLTVGAKRKATTNSAERLPSLEGLPMLSWGEIREMQRQGIVFGAHTCTHPDLTRLPPGQVEAEVRDSKAIIEDALGVPVTCFAYPYGRYDNRTREIVRRYFASACSDRLGLITAGSDLYALERVETYYVRTERLFALAVSRLFPWYLRARRIPRQARRAVRDLF
jgi:peptidoglycan/xylan/chitin deacetylase (PgdA/CDA1 family)